MKRGVNFEESKLDKKWMTTDRVPTNTQTHNLASTQPPISIQLQTSLLQQNTLFGRPNL